MSDQMNNIFVISGEKDSFLCVLKRILRGHRLIFDKESITVIPMETIILLNTSGNTLEMVNKWIWKELRLNEKKIGKEKAGLPVIVLGTSKKFLETPEGKVFRDFPLHHKYFTKPLNIYKFLVEMGKIFSINPLSLCVIISDAPDNLEGALAHDLSDISKKFDFTGSNNTVGERFHKIEIDLGNLSKFWKKTKKFAKLRKDVKILKNEILKRRGNIWQ